MPRHAGHGLSFPLAAALLFACASPGPPPGPSLERARELARNGRLAEAEDETARFLEAEQREPARRAALEERGCIRVERGQAQEALQDLEPQSEHLSPNGTACLGRAASLLGRHRQALELLTPLVVAGQADAEAAACSVRAAMALRRVDAALELAEAACRSFPADTTLGAWKARALAVNGRTAQALALLDSLERNDRESPEIPFVRGNVLWGEDRYADAVAAYEEALRLDPVFFDAMRNLGVALLQAGRYHEAVEVLSRARILSPSDVQTLNNLGVALASTGKTAEAAALYEEAMRAAPEQPVLLNNLVDVYLRLGRLAEARAFLDDLVRTDPARENACRKQDELAALAALLDRLCAGSGAAAAALQQLTGLGWDPERAAGALERVLSQPAMAREIEKKEKQCRTAPESK